MSGRGKGGKGLGAMAAREAKKAAKKAAPVAKKYVRKGLAKLADAPKTAHQLMQESNDTAYEEALEMAEELAALNNDHGNTMKYMDFDYEEDRPLSDLLGKGKKTFDDEDRPLSDLMTKNKKRKKKRPKIPIYDSEDEPVTKLYRKTAKRVKAFPVPNPEVNRPPPLPVVTQQPPLTSVIPEAILPLVGASAHEAFQGGGFDPDDAPHMSSTFGFGNSSRRNYPADDSAESWAEYFSGGSVRHGGGKGLGAIDDSQFHVEGGSGHGWM